ncbi:MAG: hypothetical protein GY749_45390 [Desulfobacteraceae bacterium]|nr:hypothetical protein [Desulfobacteraceae bacterium]
MEWVYEKASINQESIVVSEQEIIPPPREELEALYEVAMMGMLERIKEQAIDIEEADRIYI